VVVYSLDKVVVPVISFTGRAPTTFGLKELVNLSATITPDGVTGTQAGGLKWSIASGTGSFTVPPGNDGTASFRAPSSPGNTTLKLNVVGGPSKDKNITQDVTTIAPSGTRLVHSAGQGQKHTQYVVGAGFKATVYLDPKNVSFQNIQVSEDVAPGAPAQTTGYFTGVTTPHPVGPNTQILQCNTTTGCRLINEDTCYMFHPSSPTPYAPGTYKWSIPWYYDSGGGSVSLGYTVDQLLTSDASGKATISKGGASISFNVDDPTISTGGTW
jgi:hypothetical protein